jgi:hypothetical protein
MRWLPTNRGDNEVWTILAACSVTKIPNRAAGGHSCALLLVESQQHKPPLAWALLAIAFCFIKCVPLHDLLASALRLAGWVRRASSFSIWRITIVHAGDWKYLL